MSFLYLDLAFRSSISNSAVKFILVALADYANEFGEAYPSIQTLTEKTAQDRKTVIRGLQRLEEWGYLTDTGGRRGKTRQVKVWQLHLKPEEEMHAENGTVPKEELFRFSSKSVPYLGHGSVSEPPIFNTYWDCYPVKKNKAAAKRAWSQLSDDDKQAAIEGIGSFVSSLPDWQVTPYPDTFLKNRRWEDDLSPPQQKQLPKTNQQSKQRTKSSGMPWLHEELPKWAIKNGLPEARVGESYAEYRARLRELMNRQVGVSA